MNICAIIHCELICQIYCFKVTVVFALWIERCHMDRVILSCKLRIKNYEKCHC